MRDIRFAIAVLAVLAACGGGNDGVSPPGGGGGGGGGGGTLVHATRVNATAALSFDPSAVTIPAKDTIYFTFGAVQHNVHFDTPASPDSVPASSSTTVKREFPTAGTFNYHCTIHPSMTGTVTVQ